MTCSLAGLVQFQNDLILAVGAPINFKIANFSDRALKMKMEAPRVIRFNRRHFQRLAVVGIALQTRTEGASTRLDTLLQSLAGRN